MRKLSELDELLMRRLEALCDDWESESRKSLTELMKYKGKDAERVRAVLAGMSNAYQTCKHDLGALIQLAKTVRDDYEGT